MHNFKNLLLITIFLLLLTTKLSSQVFDIYQIDTTEFPKIKAFYTVKDEFYQNYTGINKNDFSVKQNGIDVNFEHKCDLLKSRPAVSLSLMLDASVSMLQKVNATEERHQWATLSAKKFVDSLKFTSGSAFNLITFGGAIDKSTDWAEDSTQARADLNKYNVGVSGATNLTKPFYDAARGSLDKLIGRPKTSKRVAVMLTDGGHEAGQPLQRNEIIKKAQDNDIEIYIILLNAPSSVGGELDALASETGGKLFRIYTKEELDVIFFNLYNSLQNQFTCRLEWLEPFICDGDNQDREVSITFKKAKPNITSTQTYLIPKRGIAKLEVSADSLYFSDINGGQLSKDITLKALVGNFKLTNYNFSPNNGSFNIDWKGNTPLDLGGLVLTEGNSRTITVNYVEKNSLDESTHKLSFIDENCKLPDVFLIAPCGGIAQDVSFTNLPLINQDLNLQNIYYNNSNRKVIVTVAKLNDIDNELILKNGNTYTVNPKEYLSLDVTFQPINSNPKEIQLQFSSVDGCSKPIAKFNATIGNINILASGLDFGEVRVKTPKNGAIKIENKSQFNILINDVEIDNNNYFVIEDIKNNPKNISPNSSININVDFISNIEQDIYESVKIKGNVVEQNNEPINLEVPLKAISFLPNLTTVPTILFPNTDISVSTNPVTLNLKNNSLFGDLKIQEIRFKTGTNSGDFKFEGTPNLNNILVTKNNETNLNLIFTPTKNGLQTATIEIIADNIEGPEPVTNVVTEVILTGNTNSKDNLVFDDINFGSLFICDYPVRQIEIDNSNGSIGFDFTVSKANNSNDFELVLPSNLQVLAGKKATFDLIYKPQQPGTHTTTILVDFSDGRSGSFKVIGNSTPIPFKSTFKYKEQNITPGQLVNIGFTSNFDADNYGPISTINYNLTFNPNFLKLAENPFTTDLTDSEWSWTVDKSNQKNGIVNISGKSLGKLLAKPIKVINSLNLHTYLADTIETFITVNTKVNNNCIESETDTSLVIYNGCMIDSRIITISKNSFYVKDLKSNYIIGSNNLEFGIGFDCNVKIDLYDVMGNLVKNLVSDDKQQGEYSLELPIENITNGIYFINLNAGPFTKTIKFNKNN